MADTVNTGYLQCEYDTCLRMPFTQHIGVFVIK